jgi:hypothetical protein
MSKRYFFENGKKMEEELPDDDYEIIEVLDDISGKLIFTVRRKNPTANIANITISE